LLYPGGEKQVRCRDYFGRVRGRKYGDRKGDSQDVDVLLKLLINGENERVWEPLNTDQSFPGGLLAVT